MSDRDLIDSALEAEPFVRRALLLLEGQFRRLALTALADWEAQGLVRPETYRAISALHRPSWGHWNGLLTALRDARRAILRSGSADERERLAGAETLEALLAWLDSTAERPLTEPLRPLAELANVRLPSRPRLNELLVLPISLRNLVAHFAPAEPAWWSRAAAAVRPLLAACTEGPLRPPSAGRAPAPWFRGEAAFNGVQDDTVLYALPSGEPLPAPDALGAVLGSFRRLLGAANAQEDNLRKLLRRLAPEELKGVLLGDYLVGPPAGEGGFATVHVGTQLSTGRKVAIKVLHDGLREADRARFQQEASFLSLLSHPNIVAVLGSGEGPWAAPRDPVLAQALSEEPWYRKFSQSAPVKSYLAMEWVEGKTFEALIGEGPRDVNQAARWMADTAAALATVHAAGLIHRDVKPSNLMLTDDGRVKLMDFGIARRQDDARTVRTGEGGALGTPAYASPEQLAGKGVGPASDIYSLCATFHELFTGRRAPPAGDTQPTQAGTTLVDAPLPWEIKTILKGGLEPGPAERYKSMADLERDVRHFLRDEPIEYRPPGLFRRLTLWYRRNPTIAGLVFTVAFLLVAGVVGSLAAAFIINEARDRAEQNAAREKTARIAETAARVAETNARIDEEKAKKKAIEKTKEAVRAGALEKEARALAESQRDEAEWLGYAGQVGLATTAWEENNVALALERLETCQWDLRGWEHDYLDHQYRRHGQSLLRGHRGPASVVRFSPDGKYVASGVEDGHVCLWDVKTRKLLWRRAGPVADRVMVAVQALEFDSDSSSLIAGGRGGRVRSWDIEGEEIYHRAKLPTLRRGFDAISEETANDFIQVLAFSPDCKKFLGGHGPFGGRSFGVWEARSGKALFTLKEEARFGLSLNLGFAAFSPDGKYIATSAERGLNLWDANTGAFKRSLGRDVAFGLASFSPTSVSFHPDGERLVLGSFSELALGRIEPFRAGKFDEFRLPFLPYQVKGAGAIECLAYNRKGDRLAFSGGDGAIRVWRHDRSLEPLLVLRGHAKRVHSISLSPDGKLAASAAEDSTLRLWDCDRHGAGPAFAAEGFSGGSLACFSPDGGRLLGKISDAAAGEWALLGGKRPATSYHIKGLLALAYSPDGKLLAAAARDGSVLVFRAGEGKPFATFKAPEGKVQALAFSPDASRLAGGDDTGTAHVWPLGGGAATTLRGHAAAVVALCFSGEGRLASASWDGTARVWDVRAGRQLAVCKGHEEQATAVCFSPTGKWLATGGADATVRIWDAASGRLLFVMKGHEGPVGAVRFAPDGARLFSAGGRTIRVWNPANGREALALKGPEKGAAAALWLSGDGRRLAAADAAGNVSTWAAGPGGAFTLRGHTGWVHAVAHAPGGRLVSAGGDETVRVWDARKGRELFRLAGHTDRVTALSVSPGGTRIASGGDDNAVIVWDAQAKKALFTLPHGDAIRGVAFRPDGGLLATCDGAVRLYDPARPSRKPLLLTGHEGSIYGVAFSLDGKRLAGAGGDGTVWVWASPEKGGKPTALKGHAEAVTAVCFGATGRLASASWDGTVKVWDVGKGRQVLNLTGPRERLSCVAISPDGRAVAAGGADRTVRLWDARGGGPPAVMADHADCVNGVSFSPDGKRLASVADDGTIVVRHRLPAPPKGKEMAP